MSERSKHSIYDSTRCQSPLRCRHDVRVIHRLTAAAAGADIRTDMNVEDEYFSAIEDCDTALRERDERIKQQQDMLKQQQQMLEKMVKAMIEKGMGVKEISLLTGHEENEIKSLLKA